MEVMKMNKNELLSGRVVKLINGEYGLITDTPNFGKLVGFYGNAVHIESLLEDDLIDSVYNITHIDQILGLGIHEDNLELVYQAVPTITTLDQLKELLEDNEIYVNIDLQELKMMDIRAFKPSTVKY